jgi:malonyl-CoA O-methyltransferase
MSEQDYPLNRASVRRSFEQAVADYDEAAVLQREVANRLIERLSLMKLQPKVVLDAGAGTGYATLALARRYPEARVIALDLAHGMACQVRSRFGFFARRFKGHGFVCGDVERLPLADASVDLVFSNLTLQWCNPLDGAFAEFRRVLRPGGLLLFSSMGPDTLKELRASWSVADSEVHVNTFLDMHDVGDALVRARLADPVMDVEHLTVTFSEVEQLLRDLKAIGAHNVNAGRPRGLTGRHRYVAMKNAYERYRRDGVLPATYEVVYGHAWAPADVPAQRSVDGEAQISMGQFKAGLKRG